MSTCPPTPPSWFWPKVKHIAKVMLGDMVAEKFTGKNLSALNPSRLSKRRESSAMVPGKENWMRMERYLPTVGTARDSGSGPRPNSTKAVTLTSLVGVHMVLVLRGIMTKGY